MSQARAAVTAAQAVLSPVNDQADITLKYENLKHTEPFHTTYKNKR